jgi:hypothetical protein
VQEVIVIGTRNDGQDSRKGEKEKEKSAPEESSKESSVQ